MTLDFTHVPVVDNHCHGIYQQQKPTSIHAWHQRFTEAQLGERGEQSEQVTTTLFYRRLLHELAEFLSCEPHEEAILTARSHYSDNDIVQKFLRAAHFDALLIDTGYPSLELVMSHEVLAQLAGCRIRPMLRVELVMQQLITEHASLSNVIEALRVALQDIRGQGYVALKSIVAYRTGLDIATWSIEDAERAFAVARREVQEKGSLRLAHKPLLDTLLHVTFEEAARQEVPVQFHTGYGDTDVDMLLGNPLHLRAVLEEQRYRGMPVVILHECYPYTRQGAYLATVYENVYLDLSYAIPLLGFREMLEFTRAAFDVAPYSKLLYSSDGVGSPELHWISALTARSIVAQVLEECVTNGSLATSEAEEAGIAMLRNNARKLYRL